MVSITGLDPGKEELVVLGGGGMQVLREWADGPAM